MTSVNLAVRRWHAWAPGLSQKADWQAWLATGAAAFPAAAATAAPVEFVDPMLRRRLSPLSRVALHCAHVALAGERVEQLIFASRHGELGTTINLLRQLAQGEALSPMGFSLSVHNTSAGLYGIASADNTPATAIAAGRDTLSACLLEAAAMVNGGADSVLVSYVEQDLPAAYLSWQEAEIPLLGLSLLIGRSGEPLRLVSTTESGPEYQSPGLAVVRSLLGTQPEWMVGEQQCWSVISG